MVTILKLLLASRVRLAPRSLLPSVKVMSPPVLVKLEVPVTARVPVWVMAPLDVTVRLPPRVDAAKIVAELSVN